MITESQITVIEDFLSGKEKEKLTVIKVYHNLGNKNSVCLYKPETSA